MLKLTEEIVKRNKVTDERAIMFLDNVVNELNTAGIPTTDYVKLILNMMIVQLVLYYKAQDEVFEDAKVSSEDSYKRRAKSPAISIMQTTNDKILNLMDKISMSPLSKAKVDKLKEKSNNKQDAGELLAALMN